MAALLITVVYSFQVAVILGVVIYLIVRRKQERAGETRARGYLQRIVEITSAKREGHFYVLDVGDTRFEVQDTHVRRMLAVNGAQVARSQTCFYSPNQQMPAAEKVGTVLLQLKTNPALFDHWAGLRGCFKADGSMFLRN